ncbi:MAG: dephospho-CoA kinase [Rhodospirillaceae bacterium]|nr:dephospho-CoA kinase [Rhodospirillaceae bacterium]
MFVLGLTGSIGMGKTTAAAMFRCHKVPVYDADASVHQLLGRGGAAVPAVGNLFPATVRDDGIDRETLGKIVFNDPQALGWLESILHPLVRKRQTAFLRVSAGQRRRLVVLDIPLLFETGADSTCDAVAVVSAPFYLQSLRVLSRSGMSEEKFSSILARQMPDLEKRRRADFVIPTGLGRRMALISIREIIKVTTRC